MQTQVGRRARCARPLNAGHTRSINAHQRRAIPLEQRINLGRKPERMTEFNSQSDLGRDRFQKILQPPHIVRERFRKLKKEDAFSLKSSGDIAARGRAAMSSSIPTQLLFMAHALPDLGRKKRSPADKRTAICRQSSRGATGRTSGSLPRRSRPWHKA